MLHFLALGQTHFSPLGVIRGGLATYLHASHHGVIGSICPAFRPSYLVGVLWLWSFGFLLAYEAWFLLRPPSHHIYFRGTRILGGGGKRYTSIFSAADLLAFPTVSFHWLPPLHSPHVLDSYKWLGYREVHPLRNFASVPALFSDVESVNILALEVPCMFLFQ